MNVVVLVGRLAQDPVVRYTASGKAVASFNVAVNRQFGQKEITDFIPVVAWERLGEDCGNSLTKGQRVLVQGRLQFRTYETQDGQKRRVGEVVAEMVSRPLADSAGDGAPRPGSPPPAAGSHPVFPGEQFPDEEIPF